MKMASLIVALLSALAGVASTLCLMKGTATVPWEMQSWSGQSDTEKAFRRGCGLILWLGWSPLRSRSCSRLQQRSSAIYRRWIEAIERRARFTLQP
jgi:hypothetical protein